MLNMWVRAGLKSLVVLEKMAGVSVKIAPVALLRATKLDAILSRENAVKIIEEGSRSTLLPTMPNPELNGSNEAFVSGAVNVFGGALLFGIVFKLIALLMNRIGWSRVAAWAELSSLYSFSFGVLPLWFIWIWIVPFKWQSLKTYHGVLYRQLTSN